MVTSRSGNVKIIIDTEEIESVQEFTFLGSQMDKSSECSPEIVSNQTGLPRMMSMN